jgi:hypothetical protein
VYCKTLTKAVRLVQAPSSMEAIPSRNKEEGMIGLVNAKERM